MWIVTKRLKTDTPTRVPLLPSALTILDRYADYPVCNNKGKALPISTNQKMNAYLKEIAGVCSINKELTYHTAKILDMKVSRDMALLKQKYTTI